MILQIWRVITEAVLQSECSRHDQATIIVFITFFSLYHVNLELYKQSMIILSFTTPKFFNGSGPYLLNQLNQDHMGVYSGSGN